MQVYLNEPTNDRPLRVWKLPNAVRIVCPVMRRQEIQKNTLNERNPKNVRENLNEVSPNHVLPVPRRTHGTPGSPSPYQMFRAQPRRKNQMFRVVPPRHFAWPGTKRTNCFPSWVNVEKIAHHNNNHSGDEGCEANSTTAKVARIDLFFFCQDVKY